MLKCFHQVIAELTDDRSSNSMVTVNDGILQCFEIHVSYKVNIFTRYFYILIVS
jgi:hypothetical protein